MSITANFRSITPGSERNTSHCFKFSPGNITEMPPFKNVDRENANKSKMALI